jgi:hypothetical protein
MPTYITLARLDAKLPEASDKAPAGPITLKKSGAAISATAEGLQQSRGKMALGGSACPALMWHAEAQNCALRQPAASTHNPSLFFCVCQETESLG